MRPRMTRWSNGGRGEGRVSERCEKGDGGVRGGMCVCVGGWDGGLELPLASNLGMTQERRGVRGNLQL